MVYKYVLLYKEAEIYLHNIGVAIGGVGGQSLPTFLESGVKPPHFVMKLNKQLILTYAII